ncbi:UNVERIFIED_CONTAM: hypothetical protein PYX00_006477 [Menopon gallinae]|uniref:Nucleolar 27S pre-rRNA processing Urb2/Npa2 C-terminal domain-containing protein n=1 Tax=Menopon gallinae TaxID=328185 RepID=A0AAW2HVK1_9NEOP
MQRSDLLLEKLNSNLDLTKRIYLAETVFKSNLSIAYKEEYILTWFLKIISESKNETERKAFIKGFCSCVGSEKMTLTPASAIRSNAKSFISKYLSKILKQNISSGLVDTTFIILKKFFMHYKSHIKQYIKIVCALLKQSLSNCQYAEVLSFTADVFKTGAIHEKFIVHLLEKDFVLFFENMNNFKSNVLVQFVQKMFFRRQLLKNFQILFHSICSNEEIHIDNQISKALISFLYKVFVSEVDIGVKTQVFCKVLDSLAKSCGAEDGGIVLEFFIILCHLIGLEQKVVCENMKSDEPGKTVVHEAFFQEAFDVQPITSTTESYTIVKALTEVLSSHAPDLNTQLQDSTFLQWFQTFVMSAVNSEDVSSIHLDFLCTAADLNTSVIEKIFIKIMSQLLLQPLKSFEDEDFSKSFQVFMTCMLRMYIKLQRLHKFILKVLQSVKNSETALTQRYIIPGNFITEFSNTVTLLPSSQALSFLDDLLNNFDECVKNLEENTGTVNVLLIQVTSALLSAFLCGVRVLNHMTPPGILRSFVERIRRLKDILGRFGKALLVRIHDREIVQPFLNLCFYWSEFELLIVYYAEDQSEQFINKDISPTDLSTVHSYLSGEEWNVLAERVSNFGAQPCYQLFLKLILQKLRTLQLKKCPTLINGEATSKYILTQLTSELYKHNVVEELTPEDVTFLLNHLSQKQSRLLLDKLYRQALEQKGDRKLLEWLNDSLLLENRKFILLSFVIILQKIGSRLGDSCPALSLELLGDNYEINQGEFDKFLECLNEILKNGIELPVEQKIMELKLLIDVLEILPLVHMPMDISFLAFTGLTFLSVVFSNVEEFIKPLLVLVYNLCRKICRTEQFSRFNFRLCIRWLREIDYESVSIVKINLERMLLKSGVYTENGLEELKELVKYVKKRKLEDRSKLLKHQISLYQDLGKVWIKTKNAKGNDEIAKYRAMLSKRIRKELEKQNDVDTPMVDSEVLVTAYCVELTRAVKMKKEENIVRMFQLNFEKFFDIAISEVRNGSKKEGYITFLTTLLVHMPQIKSHLKKNTLERIWNVMKTNSSVDWTLFYNLSDDTEFEGFLLDLTKMWKVFVLGKNKKIDLYTYFEIWRQFYSREKLVKKNLYEKWLKRLLIQITAGLNALDNFTPDQMVHLFNFIRFCISTTEIVMTSSMIDSCLDIMYNYEYKENLTSREFQNVFEACVNGASWLLTGRPVRTRDKIHNIFQLFAKLLDELVRRSSVTFDNTEEDLLALSSCSHNMEKWTSKMVDQSKDFSRVAVYFIAAVVASFVKFNIYPAVKTPLVNCIHNFLSISDSYNVEHLLRVLNPGSQQVFSGIYETYKKYYKFTGRV